MKDAIKYDDDSELFINPEIIAGFYNKVCIYPEYKRELMKIGENFDDGIFEVWIDIMTQ